MLKRKEQKFFHRIHWPDQIRFRFWSPVQPRPDFSVLPKFLTIRQTATILDVHPNTLRAWDASGKLRAVRFGARHDRRYLRDEVAAAWAVQRGRKPLRPAVTKIPPVQLSASIYQSRVRSQVGLRLKGRASTVFGLMLIVLVVGVSWSRLTALADSAATTTVSALPKSCSGWLSASQATRLSLAPMSPLEKYTSSNSAILRSADLGVSGSGGRISAFFDQINPQLTCGEFSLAASSAGMFQVVRLRLAFASTASQNSMDLIRVSSSLDGKQWTVVSTISARREETGPVVISIPEITDQSQLGQLRIRIEPEFTIGQEAIVAVDGMEAEVTMEKLANQAASDGQAGRKKELDRLTVFSKESYQATDQPTIIIPKKQTKRRYIFGKKIEEWQLKKVELLDAEERNVDPVYRTTDEVRGDDVSSRLSLRMEKFHPGKYRLRVTMISPAGTTETIEEPFLWGVFASNFRRANPTVGQTQEVLMAVLDDDGHTICDARLRAVVTDPKGRSTRFDTNNKTITTNPDCVDRGVTNEADYHFPIRIDQVGVYRVTIEATTAVGDRRLVENFTAEQRSDYDVERVDYPTRIYPPAAYPVRLAVTPQQDYLGLVTEEVPTNFSITSVSPAGTVRSEGTTVRKQFIEWLVDWKKGETYYLSYEFDAPDISPALFLTGPLTIGGSFMAEADFRENRQWQIASDSIARAASSFVPTSHNEVTVGTALTLSGTTLNTFRGALSSDNIYYAWNGSASGFDVQVNFDAVALPTGINKMLVTTETANVTSARNFLVQICDWVSSTGVDNAADAQCTTGGWRTLNNPKGTSFTETTDTSRTFELYNGYFYSGSNPGTAVSTALTNFVSGNKVKIRFYSTANDTAQFMLDRVQLEVATDPVYYPDSVTGQNSYTVNASSDYQNVITANDQRFTLTNNATNALDVYFSFKNVQTYTGANTVLVTSENGYVSNTGLTYDLAIYNFNSSSWEDLHSGQITASGATTDQSNYFAKANVTLSNYVSSNEVRIRLYSTTTNTHTIGTDLLYITVGSVNTSTGNSEISYGKADAGATPSTNTQDIDALTTSSSTNDWKQTYCKNATDSGCATSFYVSDYGGTYGTHYAAAANLSMPVTVPTNSQVTGIRFAARFRSNDTTITTALNLRDYASVNTTAGGWSSLSTTSSQLTRIENNKTANTADNAATTYAYVDGTYMVNPEDLVDTANNLVNLRLRTSASTKTTAPTDRDWDFAFVSIRWVAGTPSKLTRFRPTSDQLVTGSYTAASSAITPSFRGTLRADNVRTAITTVAANPSLNYQLKFEQVSLFGANKIIIDSEQNTANGSLTYLVQICDWVSSTGVDNAADAQCTTGGWRTLNNPKGTKYANTSDTAYTYEIFDGYFYTGSAPGTRVSTPLSNFVSGTTARIRYYSTDSVATTFSVDSARLIVGIDPIYSVAAVNSNGSYSLSVASGDYPATSIGALSSPIDASYLVINNNGSNAMDVSFTFDNVRTYTGANTIAVHFEGNPSAVSMTYNLAIYNFTSAAWEDLHSGQITAAEVGVDESDLFAKNNVNLRDYISYAASSPYYGQARIRLYSTVTGTETFSVGLLQIEVGSTNTDSSGTGYELTYGKNLSGDVTKTRDVDIINGPATSASDWTLTECKNGTDSGCSSAWYASDVPSAGYGTNYAAAANITMPITVPANAAVTGVFMVDALQGRANFQTSLGAGGKDYSGQAFGGTVVGGWVGLGVANSGGGYYQIDFGSTFNQTHNLIDTVNNVGNFRARSFLANDTTSAGIDGIDFAMLTIRYVLVGSTISLTGNVYSDDGTTVLTTCDGLRSIVALRTGGQTYGVVSCNASTGAFEFDNVPQPATSDPVYLWLSGVTSTYATTVVKYSGSGNITSVKVRQNRLVLKNDDSTALANSDLNSWQNSNDSDMVYSVSSNNLTVETGIKLAVEVGTYTPGGTVTTAAASTASNPDGDVAISSGATMTMGTNALSVGGDFVNAGTFAKSTGQTTTLTATGTGFGITMGTGNFDSLTFNGSGGGWTPSNNVTVDVNLTITNGTLTGPSGGTIAVGGSFSNSSAFTHNNGTVTMNGASGSITGSSGTTFNHLTVNNNTTVQTSNATVAGTLTLAASKTLTITTVTLTDTGGEISWGASSVITGTGLLTFTDASGGPGSGGTLSVPVRFDASAANIASTTFDARTYGGAVTLYANSGTAKSITAAAGAYTFSSTLSTSAGGAGTLTANLGAATGSPAVSVTGTLTIGATTSFTAPASATMNVGASFTNSGAFTHNSGTVALTTATSATITGSTTFNNFSVTGIGAAKAITFVNGTTTTVAGTWTVTGSAGNLITMDRDSTSAWTINPTAASVDYADISWSTNTGVAFCATHSQSTNGNNTGWSISAGASCGITVSGTIYQTGNESLGYGCNADNLTINVAVNGDATPDTGTCTAADGTFSLTATDPGAADIPIAIYIDTGETPKATTVTLSNAGGANITGLTLIVDRLTVTQESATALTNAHLSTADNGNAGIRYAVSGGTLTVDSGMELHVLSGKTFTPGGAVTTTATATAAGAAGDVHIVGTMTMGTNALNVGGDYTNAGTFNKTNTQTTTFTATGSGFTITPGTGDLNNATFSGDAGGNGTYTLSGANLTVDGTLTVNTGDTLTIDTGRTLTNTGATDVNNDGTINGAGTLQFTSASAGPDTDANSTGTYSVITRYNATGGNIASTTFDARTYSGRVELYQDATTTTNRTVTPVTDGTYTLSGSSSHLYLINDDAAQTLTLSGGSASAIFTIGGDLDYTGTGASSEIIQSGNDVWTVTGNVNFTDGTYTATSGNELIMNGTANLTNTNDLHKLTINGSGNTVTTSSAFQVTNTLTIGGSGDANNDTLTINNTVTIPNGSAVTIFGSGTDTIDGSGTLYLNTSSLSANGTVNADIYYDAVDANLNVVARTFGGDVTINDTGFGNRTVTLATAGSQIITISGNLTVFCDTCESAQPLTVNGNSNSPTVNVTGNVVFDNTFGGVTGLSFGSGVWTVGGNVNLSGTGTVSHNSGTLVMNGTGTLTSSGKTLHNFTTSGTGTITLASATHTLAGNLNLGSSATLTPGTSTVVMNGASKTIDGGGKTLYNLTISGSTTTLQNTDLTVSNTLNISASQTLSINASRTLTHTGATLTWGNGSSTISGSGTLRFTDVSGGPGTSGVLSAITRFDASTANVANTTFDARTYGGPVELYANSGTIKSITAAAGGYVFSSSLTTSAGGAGVVTANLSAATGTTTVAGAVTIGATTVLSAPAALNLSGNYSNSGTFTDNAGTVTLAGSAQQALSGTMTGSSDFNNLIVTNAFGDGSSTWSATFAGDAAVAGTFTATTANTKLRFNATSTYTFVNMTLNGQAVGTRAVLRSSSPGTQWNLTSTGTQSVSNTDVRDSNACGGDTIDGSDGTNFDATNNSCWNINTISMSISDLDIGFGSCTSAAARYATGASGSTNDSADAHTITVATDARNGYSLTVAGATLTSTVGTISAIGGSATASSAGSEQFGLRAIKNSGTGTVSSPFDTANWAFTAGSTQPVASYAGSSSSYSAQYGLRYICNVSDVTEAGSYSTNMTYVLTATF